MSVLIDQAIWPAHGTLWAHLVSDTSLQELHDFASAAGLLRRSFDHDHYDVPAERWDELVELGAHPVSVRELVKRLQASGLRVSQRQKAALPVEGETLNTPHDGTGLDVDDDGHDAR